MKRFQAVSVLIASAVGAGVAHGDPESLNVDAFDLSGALDRDVAPTGRTLEFAIGGGYTQGMGGAGSAGDVEDVTGPGGSLELQLGIRATPRFSVGMYGTLARFRRGESVIDGGRVYAATAGFQAVWHSRVDRALDPWVSVGTGWRALWLSHDDMATVSVYGLEALRIQAGIDYRISPHLAVAPVIGASASVFLVENAIMANDLTAVHDNRFSVYGFTGLLGRFDL